MKALKFIVVPLAFLSLAFVVYQNWKIKPNFVIAIESADLHGGFTKFSGNIVFDEKDLANAKFDVKVDAKSIDLGFETKEENAKKKYLVVDKFPFVTFVSSKVEKTETGYSLTGKLGLHGEEKEVTFPFTFTQNESEGQFKGSFSVKLSDFKIHNEDEIDDDLKVTLTIPVSK